MSIQEVKEIYNTFQKSENNIDNTLQTISDLEKLLENKYISDNFKKQIKTEIKVINNSNNSIYNNLQFAKDLIEYIYENKIPMKVVTSIQENSYRSSNGAYDIYTSIDFEGALGSELFDLLVSDGDFSLFLEGKNIPKNKQLSFNLSKEDFIKTLNKYAEYKEAKISTK